MYHLGYKCDVTGATMNRPLPKRELRLSDHRSPLIPVSAGLEEV